MCQGNCAAGKGMRARLSPRLTPRAWFYSVEVAMWISPAKQKRLAKPHLCDIIMFTQLRECSVLEVLVPSKKRHPDKAEALREQGALNPRSHAVKSELFQDSDFFDPRDLVQVKYE